MRGNHKRSKKTGLPPGTLVHVGERKAEKVRITLTAFNGEKYEEKQLVSIEETLKYKDKSGVLWINIAGLHEVDILEKLGGYFNIHPLVLEDVLNTAQRPKIDILDEYIFVVMKLLQYDPKEDTMDSEQISLILGSNFVISFQEKERDLFDTIRDGIKNNKGKIRKMEADYLFYSQMDIIVDNYFAILEEIEERIDNLEEELLRNPTRITLHKIHCIRRELMQIRKSIWPLREVLSRLIRGESALIKGTTSIYMRDLYDHTIQIIDSNENFRDMASGMLDIYLSSMSNKLNEIMKVLTIIATIFIPLTFIAGLYGMNFKTDLSPWNMPELSMYYGYPAVVSVMATIGIVMLVYFKKKNWF
jgi:magnesium transporter